MELDWSTQSSHIRTLFRPWQPGDGYDEDTIQAAEARLGSRLPTTLRAFYQGWGHRRDLTQTSHYLLTPEELVIQAGTLLFWEENQAACYWGVPCAALAEADPPVVVTSSGPSGWSVASELHWRPSHAHLSGFLDDMAYRQALAGGSVHKSVSAYIRPQAQQVAWLEESWSKARVTPMCFGLSPENDAPPTLYVRDGQALVWVFRCAVAAGSAEALDEIAKALQITWESGW